MQYEEKIALLSEDEFLRFFNKCGAEPRWVTSAGKRAIQMIGLCHQGEHHSALFDPDTLKVNCFSLCGGGMLFHTWVKKALGLENPQDAKDFIEEWIDNQDLDFSGRVARGTDFEYKERPYQPEIIPQVEGMPQVALDELKERFVNDLPTLERLVWHREDGIDPEILQLYDVMYAPAGKDGKDGTIILPHHNRSGEIVGIYERSFRPLRRKVKEDFPDISYKDLLQYPRAKYVPLLRDEKYRDEEGIKTSWSFPNSQNLYGLHLAAESIKETKRAIVFEGGKSVMLARQYGFPFAVATHTFGIHTNQISMLIECGAEEIILAFDKQYQQEDGQEWELYRRKTESLAAKVGDFCKISRMIDRQGLLGYKDSPIDRGKETFEKLYVVREVLTKVDEEPIRPGLLKCAAIQQLKNEEKRRRSAAQMERGLNVLLKGI